jgi:hypothetical protein
VNQAEKRSCREKNIRHCRLLATQLAMKLELEVRPQTYTHNTTAIVTIILLQ